MNELEQSVIDAVKSDGASLQEAILALQRTTPIDELSTDFLNDPSLKKYMDRVNGRRSSALDKNFGIWLLVAHYTHSSSIEDRAKFLKIIEKPLLGAKKEIDKPTGQGLLPKYISRELIASVYLTKDKDLISLFKRYLPVPREDVFGDRPIPEEIIAQTQEAEKSIEKLLEKRALSSVEEAAVKVQRRFRAKRRQRQELQRIARWEFLTEEGSEKVGEEEAREVLADANKPYRPKKCSPKLAERICSAAKKVKLFSTIHHLTSEGSLTSIFDDCLYGRQTLLKRFMPFNPAALGWGDLEEGGGDANVICFGPHEIDPAAIQKDSVKITLDLNKIPTNPCIFYKQRDLNYFVDKRRTVELGESTNLRFSHTHKPRLNEPKFTYFLIEGENGSNIAYSELPVYSFIAYNLPEMDQILALNFFRFIDTLNKMDNSENIELTKKIYSDIEKLDDKQLVAFLQSLGEKMTDTAEFNFFGAYKIDLQAIQRIYVKEMDYTFVLSNFVKDLQGNNQAVYDEAIKNIPHLFKSYRFLDFLLAKDPHPEIKKQLETLRSECVTPPFMKRKTMVSASTQKNSPMKELQEILNALQSSAIEGDKEEIAALIAKATILKEKNDLNAESVLPNKKTLGEYIELSFKDNPWLKKELGELFKKPPTKTPDPRQHEKPTSKKH